MGNSKKKMAVNQRYDENLVKKYGQDAVDRLKHGVHMWFTSV